MLQSEVWGVEEEEGAIDDVIPSAEAVINMFLHLKQVLYMYIYINAFKLVDCSEVVIFRRQKCIAIIGWCIRKCLLYTEVSFTH